MSRADHPSYDQALRVIEGAHGPVRLSEREGLLWETLCATDGASIDRDELMRRCSLPNGRAVDFAIRRLRQKIEADPEAPRVLLTVHGTGYRISSEIAPPPPLPTSRLSVGLCEVDLDAGLVHRSDRKRALSTSERRALTALVDADGDWVRSLPLPKREIDAAIGSLRQLIEPDPESPIYLLEGPDGCCLRRERAPSERPLIGRDDLLDALCTSVEAHHLTVITGSIGVGKSALLREVAKRCARNAVRIDASACASEGALFAEALQALGSPPSTQATAAALAARLSRSPALLLFDHVESLLDNAVDLEALFVALLSVRGVRILLASSRSWSGRRLGAHVVAVGGLSVADGASLYRQVALRSGSVPSPAEESAILVFVRAIDGNPLGIEIVARRVASDPPSSWSPGGADWSVLLGDDRRWIDNVLRWSWTRANAAQRRALVACQVFRGPFALIDAEEVCGCPLSLLRTLAAQGWLAPAFSAHSEPTYQLSVPIRTLLASLGHRVEPEVRRAHADCVGRWAVRWLGWWRNEDHQKLMEIGPSIGDLFAAVEALEDEPEQAAPIAILLHRLRARGHIELVEALSEHPLAFPSKARLWMCRARRSSSNDDLAHALDAALAAGLSPSDPEYATLHSYLDPDERHEAPSEQQARADWLIQRSQHALVRRSFDEAERHLRELERCAAESADPLARLAAKSIRAQIAAHSDRPQREIGEQFAALALAWEVHGDLQSAARANLIASFMSEERADIARTLADRALTLAIEAGDVVLENNAQILQAWASIGGNDLEDALIRAVSGQAIARSLRDNESVAIAIAIEAVIRATLGEPQRALASIERAPDNLSPDWRLLLDTIAAVLDEGRPFPDIDQPSRWFGRVVRAVHAAREGVEGGDSIVWESPFVRRLLALSRRAS